MEAKQIITCFIQADVILLIITLVTLLFYLKEIGAKITDFLPFCNGWDFRSAIGSKEYIRTTQRGELAGKQSAEVGYEVGGC